MRLPHRGKSPTKCDAQLAESNFQTHSGIITNTNGG
ncbi:DUF6783 domain-containing protein [Blautia pseudococcoides]